MSVYIKGMEMPTNEPLLVKINPDGSVSTTARNGYKKYTAVPVPEHGRLGDLDALEAKCTDEKGSYFGYEAAIIGGAVSSAPTIIPADPIKDETE